MNLKLIKNLVLITYATCAIGALASCGANRTVAVIDGDVAKIYVTAAWEKESPEKFYKEVKKALEREKFTTLAIVGHSVEEILRLAAVDFGNVTGLIIESDEDGERLNNVISLYNNIDALSFEKSVDLSGIMDMPNIKTLSINRADKDDPNASGLSHFPNVQTLMITNAGNLEKFAPHFIKMNELTELSFIDCAPVPMGGELHKSYALINKLRVVNGKPVEETAGYEAGEHQLLRQNAEEFVATIIGKYPANTGNTNDTPKIDGKILIATRTWTHDKINIDCKDTSNEFTFNNSGGLLPDEIFVASADDCDTLVYVWSESTETGEYSDGSKAYDDTYFVRVIDLNKNMSYQTAIIAKASATFMKFEGQAGHGPFDYDKIYEYVNSLLSQ